MRFPKMLRLNNFFVLNCWFRMQISFWIDWDAHSGQHCLFIVFHPTKEIEKFIKSLKHSDMVLLIKKTLNFLLHTSLHWSKIEDLAWSEFVYW